MADGGNFFETELYANLFKGTVLVEPDRIGEFKPREIGGKSEPKSIPANERRRRLQALLNALDLLWGGGRTARLLADLSPKFIAYTRLTVKHPVFLEALSAHYEDGGYVLEVGPFTNAPDKFAQYRVQETTLFRLEQGERGGGPMGADCRRRQNGGQRGIKGGWCEPGGWRFWGEVGGSIEPCWG
ncbi:MAG: type I-B CRISPR-associated protein Cas7/Cst2/DevR [Dehalococcoidia bacterium]